VAIQVQNHILLEHLGLRPPGREILGLPIEDWGIWRRRLPESQWGFGTRVGAAVLPTLREIAYLFESRQPTFQGINSATTYLTALPGEPVTPRRPRPAIPTPNIREPFRG
jgi:hypothetical protein